MKPTVEPEWEVVVGDDGQQYFRVNGLTFPTIVNSSAMLNTESVLMLGSTVPVATALTGPVPNPLTDTSRWTTLGTLAGPLAMQVETWLPQQPATPPDRLGRFRNLDFEE